MGGIMPKSHIAWNKGLKTGARPQWVKDKISKTDKEAFASGKRKCWCKGTKGIVKASSGSFKPGKLNPYWNGGGKLHYAEGFTYKLRKKIKTRDNYICQDCGVKGKLVVHHKDFGKINHKESNLITLCFRCHRLRHIYKIR
jgi:hypothetical protein